MATAIAIILFVSGVGLVRVSIASQRQVAQPPAAATSETSRDPVPAVRPTQDPPPEVTEATLVSSKPVTLDIPAIDVHSDLQYLGLDEQGALETPAPGPRYDDAAWYRHSPTPGSLGPAVLLGHVDSAANGPSVFFRLGELRRGDRVSVTRADGSVAIFIVDEVRRYSKNDFPTEIVYSDIDHAGLRILTCGGAFDDATGHYLDNIVVFASLL